MESGIVVSCFLVALPFALHLLYEALFGLIAAIQSSFKVLFWIAKLLVLLGLIWLAYLISEHGVYGVLYALDRCREHFIVIYQEAHVFIPSLWTTWQSATNLLNITLEGKKRMGL